GSRTGDLQLTAKEANRTSTTFILKRKRILKRKGTAMTQDVSSEVAGLISGAKVFGSSDNIRHGVYKFRIKRIFAQLVEVEGGQHKFAFVEMTPIESRPNPQTEGDHTDYPGVAGPLKDDGTRPNQVGSNCALKVDFDGAGARSAGANIKQFILALFNKRD